MVVGFCLFGCSQDHKRLTCTDRQLIFSADRSWPNTEVILFGNNPHPIMESMIFLSQ